MRGPIEFSGSEGRRVFRLGESLFRAVDRVSVLCVCLFFVACRCYFLFTLAVFITGQSILQQLREDPANQTDASRRHLLSSFTCDTVSDSILTGHCLLLGGLGV